MVIKKIENYFIKEDSFFGARIVYPIKKDLDKPYSLENINWFNFLVGGSWGKFISTMLVIILVLFSIWAYKHDTKFCHELAKNPSSLCNQIAVYSGIPIQEIKWNEINLTGRSDGETT